MVYLLSCCTRGEPTAHSSGPSSSCLSEKVSGAFAVVKDGLTLSNHWFNPFGYWVQTTKAKFYQNHPVGARCLTIPVNGFLGLIKVMAFPAVAVAIMGAKILPIGITAAIGSFAAPMFILIGSAVLAMPVIATVKFCQGKSDEGKRWLAAWVFALVAAAGAAGFLFTMAFHLNLLQSSVLIAVGGSIGIITHVYRVAKAPKFPAATS
ncbi:MAG: hypothetical protein JSS62_01295 [Verrucomicrobia bacterium]|nr:hypothetical protein [Verrucomicrobiota bacterium]MBS0646104.1 hypothetical protein [Verrucomicrobiota bacterium]